MVNNHTRFDFIARVFFLVLISCASLGIVSAQDTSAVKKWNFLTDVYLMFPYMDGEAGERRFDPARRCKSGRYIQQTYRWQQ